jgi:hypothetical protein
MKENEAPRPIEPTQECLEKEIPIELSMSGHNSFYFHCNTYHGRSNFAVCQHTIDAVEAERVQLRSECPTAIACGTCPAMGMRQREREAGRALFFSDRRVRLAQLDESIKQGSELVQYGKPRSAASQMKTSWSPSREPASVRSTTINGSTSAPQKSDVINADLAGRNLLGDAIGNLMEASK